MNSNYLDNYGPLVADVYTAPGLAGALIVRPRSSANTNASREKDQPYECGMRPTGDARQPFSVHFYMVACCLFCSISRQFSCIPGRWFISDLKVFGFVEMLLYIIILLVGYIFLWKKGALDWRSADRPSGNGLIVESQEHR